MHRVIRARIAGATALGAARAGAATAGAVAASAFVVGVVAVAVLSAPGTAHATPATGVTAEIISKTTTGGRDYVLRKITIAPGGSTGWHHHAGTVYAAVRRGTLTHTTADCTTTETYRAGEVIVEPAGANRVHLGRNLGHRPLVLLVLYVNPAGRPLATDDVDPGCGFR